MPARRRVAALHLAAAVAAAAGATTAVTADRAAAVVTGLAGVTVAALATRAMRRSQVDGTSAGKAGDLEPRLLTDAVLETALRGRIAVAKRALRPMSLVYFEAMSLEGGTPHPLTGELLAASLRATLRESDVIGRAGLDTYVFVLEDTGEDGAVWTAERLRRTLGEGGRSIRFRAGVATYPNHGLEPFEVRERAVAALGAARTWDQDRIEVATPSA